MLGAAMTIIRAIAALFAAGLAFFFTSLPAAALPPVEAFGALPEFSQPRLAPDGRHFAVVRALRGKSAAVIYRVDAPDGTQPAIVDATQGSIAAIDWVNSNRLLVVVKTNLRATSSVQTFLRAFTVDTQGKNLAAMLTNVEGLRFNLGGAAVASMDLDNPEYIYMALIGPGSSNKWLTVHLYRVNVATGLSDVFAQGLEGTRWWVMDGSRVVARLDVNRREYTYHINIPNGAGFRDIGAFSLRAGGDEHVGGVSMDGKGLVMRMQSATRTEGLYRIDLATLERTQLYANAQYDVAAVMRDEWTGRVIGAAYVADKAEYVFFDPRRQRFQGAIERAFPGRHVQISSCDRAATSCVIGIEGPRDPTSYYFIDVPTMRAQLIGSAYPRLAASDLGAMRPYPYAARDGLQIPAYLTLPPGREAKALPLVVMPHGGPEVRDEMGFDWLAAFLANRGYAVLQPNFRGSDGYGAAFRQAGFHQWGMAMQTDLSDGVAKLVAEGIVDPKRVCIFGLSYGGYAALAGAAFTPETYACAASVAGVSDLEAMLRFEELDSGRESTTVSYWKARIGDHRSSADARRIRATSPALHTDRVRVPVLLMHGVEDTIVPIAQSVIMRDALRRANKPVQYVELNGDDHHLTLAETRIRVLGELEKFLAANIGR
jgi:dipeptidyl aminopeptidase/acylaminoacyl peptidase